MWGKVGVSVSGADGNRVYTLIENEAAGGLYVSDDAGASWKLINDNRNMRQRAFYYTRVNADPVDKDTVYVLNVQFFRSTDGGKTTTNIRVPHGDNHDLWISSTNNKRMVQANDGSANVTWNGGQTWTGQDIPTGQFYNVFTTRHVPYHICGAQQDNSTACVGSQANPGAGEGSLPPIFYAVGGGESGYIAADPSDPNVFFAGSYGGYLSRLDRETGQQRSDQHLSEQPDGLFLGRHQGTLPVDVSDRVLAAGSEGAVCDVAARVAHHQRRPELGAHQPQPGAFGSENDAGLGRSDHQGPDRRRNLRRGVHARAVAAGHQHDLGRLR